MGRRNPRPRNRAGPSREKLADTLTVKNEAKVVRVKGKQLYLNIGKGQGVLAGHQFEIVHLGDPIIDAGETLGYEEQATATVLRSTGKPW